MNVYTHTAVNIDRIYTYESGPVTKVVTALLTSVPTTQWLTDAGRGWVTQCR